jgi:hypothetical protein
VRGGTAGRQGRCLGHMRSASGGDVSESETGDGEPHGDRPDAVAP